MGMSGMTADAFAKYASASNENKAKSRSAMTVAEVRNYVNPMTKYYDKLPAKDFIEDNSISTYDKLNAIFGKIANTDPDLSTSKIEAMFDMIRKVVA